MKLLFVCTGNVCRSPVAERLAVMWTRQRLGSRATELQIHSAGVRARPGEPMDERSAVALLRLGGDPSGFRSRPLTTLMAREADLVITMTRQHRRLVLEQAPQGLRRTFTLLEASALLRHVDPSGLVGLPLPDRARELGLCLDSARALRTSSPTDDVLDPIGHRRPVHQQVADQIAAALGPLVAVLFDLPEPRLAGPTDPHRSITA